MSEPYPTPPITWQGRDAKGNVVDVTSEVSVVTQPPAIETGTSEATIYQTTTTITDAQIKALNSTYVELAPAPGAGNLNIMVAAVIVLNTSAGAYTGADDDCYFEIVYGDWDGDASVSTPRATTDDALEQANITRWALTPLITEETAGVYVSGDVFSAANAPLKLAMFNSGALGGGNASNTMKVSVWYGVFEV